MSYLIFLWSSLILNNIEKESPDMLMSVFVYLATAIILYLRKSPGSWLAFFSLGAVLGLGYLAKAPMFPLAFVYLGVALILAGNLRKGVPSAIACFHRIPLDFSASCGYPVAREGRIHFW